MAGKQELRECQNQASIRNHAYQSGLKNVKCEEYLTGEPKIDQSLAKDAQLPWVFVTFSARDPPPLKNKYVFVGEEKALTAK